MEAGDYADARGRAESALRSCSKGDNSPGADLALARRHLGGALLHLCDFDAAFAALEVAMRSGPALFPSAASAGGAAAGSRQRAVEEARTVALWATETDPEWVRALGVLFEAFIDDEGNAATLQARYETAPCRFAQLAGSADDFDRLLDPLEQRSARRAVSIAQRCALDVRSLS